MYFSCKESINKVVSRCEGSCRIEICRRKRCKKNLKQVGEKALYVSYVASVDLFTDACYKKIASKEALGTRLKSLKRKCDNHQKRNFANKSIQGNTNEISRTAANKNLPGMFH